MLSILTALRRIFEAFNYLPQNWFLPSRRSRKKMTMISSYHHDRRCSWSTFFASCDEHQWFLHLLGDSVTIISELSGDARLASCSPVVSCCLFFASCKQYLILAGCQQICHSISCCMFTVFVYFTIVEWWWVLVLCEKWFQWCALCTISLARPFLCQQERVQQATREY